MYTNFDCYEQIYRENKAGSTEIIERCSIKLFSLNLHHETSIRAYLVSQDNQGRFQFFSDARMWTQCTPQKLDIVAAVSSLYLNNLAS